MPENYMRAASEINQLWLSCLDHAALEMSGCPTDEKVAEVIEKHIPITKES